MRVRQPGWTRYLQALLLSAVLPMLLAACATPRQPADPGVRWVASWASAQMIPDAAQAWAPAHWQGAALRQVVRVSLGGPRLRVRLSNVFGTTPLVVEAASVALAVAPGRSAVQPQTRRPLTFDGRAEVTVPPGAERTSDPVSLPHAAFDDLAVSMRVSRVPAPQTVHPGSRTTSFLAHGARVDDVDWPDAERVVRWFQLAAIETEGPAGATALAVIGDSIADGYGTTTDGNDRWTDFFARRLAVQPPAAGVPRALINLGIGGNRLLRDGLGPSLASRFTRDVLDRAGVSHALVHIGVNDLGVLRRSRQDTPAARAQLVADMQHALQALALQARQRGVCLIGATVLPFGGSAYYLPDAGTEDDRQALNRWIRESGTFDAVVDFDRALRDPARPDRLRADLDSGDGLHPSIAGYRAMSQALPIDALAPCSALANKMSHYRNPVLSGFHADPSICRVGGDYYLATSSFEYFPGVPIHHSRDLVHWRLIGHALSRESQLALQATASSKGIFAPTLRCHGGRYYLVTTHIDGGGNFLVHADDPAGPWSDPVWLKESVFGMDPSLFFDDDGKVYYTRHGGGREGGIYQAEIDLAAGRLLAEPRLIWRGTGGIWPEGPHLYKRDGWYLLLISEGGTSYGHMLTVARSRSPWGPFEPHPGNPILSHRHRPDLPLQALGHGDLVQTPQGHWWMVLLGIRPRERHHHLGRETMLAPVSWDDQGWPHVHRGRTLEETMFVTAADGLPPAAPWPERPTREAFSGDRLPPHWVHLRGPASGLWSLRERPGWLRLRGNGHTLDGIATPALVAQPQRLMRLRATTRLEFTPEAEGQAAGLVLRQNETHHAMLVVVRGEGGGRRVELRARVGGVTSVLGSAAIEAGGSVGLRFEGDADRYRFWAAAASAGEGPATAWRPLGEVPTRWLSSETAGGFTGVFVGLYAGGAQAGVPMPAADFAEFELEPLD